MNGSNGEQTLTKRHQAVILNHQHQGFKRFSLWLWNNPARPHESESSVCGSGRFGFWLLLFTHTTDKTAPRRVCVKLLRIKIYARLGGKTVSNDATRGRVQAAEAWLTVRRLLCFRLWHFSFWTVKSEALQVAASESDRFRALCAEILPDISTLAPFSCPTCCFKRGSARDLSLFVQLMCFYILKSTP